MPAQGKGWGKIREKMEKKSVRIDNPRTKWGRPSADTLRNPLIPALIAQRKRLVAMTGPSSDRGAERYNDG
jgi:hypothetical protein